MTHVRVGHASLSTFEVSNAVGHNGNLYHPVLLAVRKQANVDPGISESRLIKISHTFTLDERHGEDPEREPLYRKAMTISRGLMRFMGSKPPGKAAKSRTIPPPGTDEEGYIDAETFV